MSAFLKRLLRAVLALLFLALALLAWRAADRPSSRLLPRCDGLACNDQEDCGRRCRCEIPPGSALGRCKASD
jgi:hypothetical protein